MNLFWLGWEYLKLELNSLEGGGRLDAPNPVGLGDLNNLSC